MMASEILSKVGVFAADLIGRETDNRYASMVAAALAFAAETIYKNIGGAKLAAEIFYNIADKCAGETVPKD